MPEREMLEMAARAAGIPLSWSEVDGISPRRTDTWETWNPRESDGDAFRLAVALRLDICTEDNDPHPTEDRQIRHVNVWPFGGGVGCSEDLDESGDPLAATRLAITRAAASIGEKMPLPPPPTGD